jgi:hypothetical protein
MFREVWKILPVFVVELLARKRLVKGATLYWENENIQFVLGYRVFDKIIFLEKDKK